MKFERLSGILLHPTSLPGPYGIGDIGPEAFKWLEFLDAAGCGLWQVLPLGPTGYGDSPYQCFSAFAGNPYLISPDSLMEDGLLTADDLANRPLLPADHVDFGKVIVWKLSLLDRAFNRFQQGISANLRAEYDAFCAAQADWLDDFALFMALKEVHGGASWVNWEAPLRDRKATALRQALQKHRLDVQRQIFRQFIFFRQWQALRSRAQALGIQIIGDIPIFVAHDSADVWVQRELFYLDAEGNPTVVAGVPPDYFSPTGQLWGNPLYRWDVHRASGYAWWLARIRSVLALVDIIRLDHFRGFAAYWEVPAGNPTAEIGRWVRGPGKDLFETVRAALGELPIIAEDLGVITPDVVELRDGLGLPGMKIFQFAFANDASDPFLPHNYPRHCVVYTGTHDNDTAWGWYQRVDEKEKDFFRRYVARDGRDVAWDMIRAVWSSVATFALAPMQDVLGLDNTARMNYPGNPSGNWSWRMSANALDDALCARLKEFNTLYLRDKTKPLTTAISQYPQPPA